MNLSAYMSEQKYHKTTKSPKITQIAIKDPSYIKSPSELFQEKRAKILSNLDIGKLERSITKVILGKQNSYSHKELTKIAMELGKNFSETKALLVEQLLRLKIEYDKQMNY